MKIESNIQQVINSIEELTKFVKTHQGSTVNYKMLDQLEKSASDLQESIFELEARANDEEDLEGYEEV